MSEDCHEDKADNMQPTPLRYFSPAIDNDEFAFLNVEEMPWSADFSLQPISCYFSTECQRPDTGKKLLSSIK